MNDLEDHSRSLELPLFEGPSINSYSVVTSYNSILHSLEDITTFTVYMNACDLEKSFTCEKTAKITIHHVHFLIDE